MDIMDEIIPDDNEQKYSVDHRLRFNDNRVIEDVDAGAVAQPEYDASIDERLPETVTLLTTPEGGKLYLVGTAHFSIESQNDVAMIIQAVQPQIVVLELCKARLNLINCTEEVLCADATNLSYKNLRQTLKVYGTCNGLLHIIVEHMIADIVKQLGMPPGGEFRTAFKEAKKIPNCIIQLADRAINVTLTRAVRQLSWCELIKLLWHLLHLGEPISMQDVERNKRKSVIEELSDRLKQQYPTIERIFVTERDVYLTYNLQVATTARVTSKGSQPPRVVAVVGIGHMNGIVENWGKVKISDIWPIMEVPPQPLSSKILKFTLKVSLLVTVMYVGYKIIPLPSGSTLQSIGSSIMGLLEFLGLFCEYIILVSMWVNGCTDKYEHTIPRLMYVVHNIPGPGIDIEEFESEYSLGCSCTNECSDCLCTRGSPNYINGRILIGKSTGPIIECNSHCTCTENCGNRVVQAGPLDSLIVSESGEKGLGLFSTKFIEEGQFICEYAGELIGINEAQRRVDANKNSMNYVLVVFEHIGEQVIVTCIDPKYFGNIGRYANHSCEPNANVIPIRVEGPIPRLCLFASKNIEIDEEITFNYADGVANSVRNLSNTPCLCGSYKCYGYLPHDSI